MSATDGFPAVPKTYKTILVAYDGGWRYTTETAVTCVGLPALLNRVYPAEWTYLAELPASGQWDLVHIEDPVSFDMLGAHANLAGKYAVVAMLDAHISSVAAAAPDGWSLISATVRTAGGHWLLFQAHSRKRQARARRYARYKSAR